MRAVFASVLIMCLGTATRTPSETQGQTDLELETVQVELNADAMGMVVKASSFPHANGVSDSLAQDGLLMPAEGSLLNTSDGLKRGDTLRKQKPFVATRQPTGTHSSPTDPFSPTGGDDASPLSFKTTERYNYEQSSERPVTPDYTYLQLLGWGGFGETWSVVEGKPESLAKFEEERHELVARYNEELRSWKIEVAKNESYLDSKPKLEAKIDGCPPLAAIKVSKKTLTSKDATTLITQEEKDDMWREVNILQKLHGNQYVSQIAEAFQDKQGRHYIVMQHLPGGDLFDKVTEGKYTMEDAKVWSRELLTGLQSIHSSGVAHRDIKLENLIFNEQMKPRFIDFGFAVTPTNDTHRYSDTCGSAAYVAPEILRRRYLPKKTDVFALGVVLFTLISGANRKKPAMPFSGLPHISRRWTQQQEDKLRDRGVNDKIIDICKAMLQFEGDRESDLQTLKDMPWE